MYIESFKKLTVWQKAIDLAQEVYVVTGKLPGTESYGLTSQMRRCAVSIPSNISEGRKRGTRKDFVQFLRVASGSAAELETQLILAQSIYRTIPISKAFSLLEEIQKMLSVMVSKLSSVPSPSKSYQLKAKS